MMRKIRFVVVSSCELEEGVVPDLSNRPVIEVELLPPWEGKQHPRFALPLQFCTVALSEKPTALEPFDREVLAGDKPWRPHDGVMFRRIEVSFAPIAVSDDGGVTWRQLPPPVFDRQD